jgi:hypothetical protein
LLIGFVVAVKSIFSIAHELSETSKYKYFPTYKFSQDHIELFFSKIRQLFGNNNNPNVIEFKTAMKKLLLKNSVSSSYATNCILMDSTNTNSIFVGPKTKKHWIDTEDIIVDEVIDDALLDSIPNNYGTNLIKDTILYYISGFIVRSIYLKIDCDTCVKSFMHVSSDYNYCHEYSFYVLTDVKNRGGLVKSSIDVIQIVKFVEITLSNITNNLTNMKSCISSKIIIYTKNYVFSNNIFHNLNCYDNSFLEIHKLNLATLICKQYLKIRLHHLAKSKLSNAVSKRRLLTKLILFNNQ